MVLARCGQTVCWWLQLHITGSYAIFRGTDATRIESVVSSVWGLFTNMMTRGSNGFQEFFRSCLDYMRMIPQLYQIHEMTSLTGGTFNPGLKLTFEKQLLIMVTHFWLRTCITQELFPSTSLTSLHKCHCPRFCSAFELEVLYCRISLLLLIH